MRNYQKELEKLIEKNQKEEKVPSLLLHSCCAPCSSYCLSYLSQYFRITLLYYNPNIYPEEEYFSTTKCLPTTTIPSRKFSSRATTSRTKTVTKTL
ncbi:MAG: epoxyqueuosine reductase QueH [Clostridia bacterium]|nr:epoxyqueuosine reductase QueH [Clostridia bacterium]